MNGMVKVIRWFAAAEEEEDGSTARTHTCERLEGEWVDSLCLIHHKLHLLCHLSGYPMSHIPHIPHYPTDYSTPSCGRREVKEK